MNRFKFLIAPDAQQQQQIAFDRSLTSRIKKFSSERNLFFANIYSNHSSSSSNLNNAPDTVHSKEPKEVVVKDKTDKPPSRLEKTKSFCRGGLLKKCKSLRDLYQARSGSGQSETREEVKEKSSFKNLDEFERNYLFSAGKRDLVRELRKNFETGQKKNEIPAISNVNSKATYRKCDFSEIDDMDGPPLSLVPDQQAPRGLNQCHSFKATTTETSTSILQRELNQEYMRKVRASTTTRPELSHWTRSEMDLSSLSRPPLPSHHNVRKTATKNVSRDELQDDTNTEEPTSLVLSNNQRNLQRYRSTDGETMSLCDMSMYPIYMQNINDTNSLADTQKTDQGDSGISLNNNHNLVSTNIVDKPKLELQSNHPHIRSSVSANAPCGNRLKKYSSVNQIDLDVLKNELNDFVDMTWNLNSAYHHRSTSSLVSSVRRKVNAQF